MLKLLIVDDEAYVREGIAQMLRRSLPESAEILTAASGREGLTLAEAERPEIIVSDVRRPQMNGLDMAHALIERLPGAKLIFISAYSEIEYYRAALKLRAVSFVEKPIIPEELLAEVRRAMELFSAERRVEKTPLSEEEREELTLLSLLHCGPQTQLQGDFRPGKYLTLFAAGRLGGAQDAQRIARVRESIRRAAEPEHEQTLCGMDGSSFVLLLSSQTPPGARVRTLAQTLLDGFGDAVFVTCAPANGAADVPRALETALARQTHQFFHSHAYFYDAGGDSAVIRSAPNVCTAEFLAELTECIEQRQADRAAHLAAEGLNLLRTPVESEPEQVRMTAMHLLSAAGEVFLRLGVENTSAVGWTEVAQPESFDALIRFVEHALSSSFAALDAMDDGGRCVYQIKRGIEQGYADPDFSVARLVRQLRLSESHAGNLFKRRTGMTIGGYLNIVRMERAKQLLNDPSSRVSEVCQQVGIENADYFARRFKQYTGRTPSEYRR